MLRFSFPASNAQTQRFPQSPNREQREPTRADPPCSLPSAKPRTVLPQLEKGQHKEEVFPPSAKSHGEQVAAEAARTVLSSREITSAARAELSPARAALSRRSLASSPAQPTTEPFRELRRLTASHHVPVPRLPPHVAAGESRGSRTARMTEQTTLPLGQGLLARPAPVISGRRQKHVQLEQGSRDGF